MRISKAEAEKVDSLAEWAREFRAAGVGAMEAAGRAYKALNALTQTMEPIVLLEFYKAYEEAEQRAQEYKKALQKVRDTYASDDSSSRRRSRWQDA